MYQKVHQYGDITEVYTYAKEPTFRKRHPSPLKAYRLQNDKKNLGKHSLSQSKKKTRKPPKIRSTRSIKRSVESFYRLCHHNNCLHKKIDFLTITFAHDVTYEKANRHFKKFLERIKKYFPEIPFNYISVPEKQKSGRLHYHLLVYDLPAKISQSERKTRNFQRLFGHGFIDIRSTTYFTSGIAGYMAKYMAKAFNDDFYAGRKLYTCSRKIERPTTYKGYQFYHFTDYLDVDSVIDTRSYDVPYLGHCQVVKYKNKNASNYSRS